MEKNDVSSRDESFNLGSASRDEISSQDERFIFLRNLNLFFILKTMTRWDEISTRFRNNFINDYYSLLFINYNNFFPGWTLPYNQPLKTLQLSYKFPKVYRYDDILSFFPSSGLKPRINFCSQICTNMK